MQPYFTSNGLVTKALEHAFKLEHIMDLTRLRCLGSLFSMLHQACRNVAQYNANHPDFPMQIEQLERYIQVRERRRRRRAGLPQGCTCVTPVSVSLPKLYAHLGVFSFRGTGSGFHGCQERCGCVTIQEHWEPLSPRLTLL